MLKRNGKCGAVTIVAVLLGGGPAYAASDPQLRVEPSSVSRYETLTVRFQAPEALPAEECGADGNCIEYFWKITLAWDGAAEDACERRLWRGTSRATVEGAEGQVVAEPRTYEGWCPGTWTAGLKMVRESSSEPSRVVKEYGSVAFSVNDAEAKLSRITPAYGTSRTGFKLRYYGQGVDAEGFFDVLHLVGPDGTRCAGPLIDAEEYDLGDADGPQTIWLDPFDRHRRTPRNTTSYIARRRGTRRPIRRWCPGVYRAWVISNPSADGDYVSHRWRFRVY